MLAGALLVLALTAAGAQAASFVTAWAQRMMPRVGSKAIEGAPCSAQPFDSARLTLWQKAEVSSSVSRR